MSGVLKNRETVAEETSAAFATSSSVEPAGFAAGARVEATRLRRERLVVEVGMQA
jgi:hypothetical protein